MASMNFLEALPNDVVYEIMLNLVYSDTVSLCRTCRTLYQHFGIENFGHIWQFFYRQTISAIRVPDTILISTQGTIQQKFSKYFKKTRFLQAARQGYDLLAHRYLHELEPRYWRDAAKEVLHDVARCGYVDMLDWLITLVPVSFVDTAAAGAAEAGNQDLLDHLQSKVPHSHLTHGIIYGAAKGGHRDILNPKIHYDYQLHNSIRGAAEGGHRDLLFELLKQQPNYDHALYHAAEGGHWELSVELLNCDADADRGLRGAASGGHLDLVIFFLQHGACAYGAALLHAADEGHEHIFNYIFNLYHSGFPDLGGSHNTVRYKLIDCLEYAAENGHLEIIKRILQENPSTVNAGIYRARVYGYPEIAEFLENWHNSQQSYPSTWLRATYESASQWMRGLKRLWTGPET